MFFDSYISYDMKFKSVKGQIIYYARYYWLCQKIRTENNVKNLLKTV